MSAFHESLVSPSCSRRPEKKSSAAGFSGLNCLYTPPTPSTANSPIKDFGCFGGTSSQECTSTLLVSDRGLLSASTGCTSICNEDCTGGCPSPSTTPILNHTFQAEVFLLRSQLQGQLEGLLASVAQLERQSEEKFQEARHEQADKLQELQSRLLSDIDGRFKQWDLRAEEARMQDRAHASKAAAEGVADVERRMTELWRVQTDERQAMMDERLQGLASKVALTTIAAQAKDAHALAAAADFDAHRRTQQMASLEEKFERLKGQLEASPSFSEEKFERLKGQFETSLERHKGQLETSFERHKGQLETSFERLKVQLETFQISTSTSQANIEGAMASLKAEQVALQANLERGVEFLRTDQAALQARLGDLHATQLDRYEKSVGERQEMQSRLLQLEEKVGAFAGSVRDGAWRDVADALGLRLSELEKRLVTSQASQQELLQAQQAQHNQLRENVEALDVALKKVSLELVCSQQEGPSTPNIVVALDQRVFKERLEALEAGLRATVEARQLLREALEARMQLLEGRLEQACERPFQGESAQGSEVLADLEARLQQSLAHVLEFCEGHVTKVEYKALEEQVRDERDAWAAHATRAVCTAVGKKLADMDCNVTADRMAQLELRLQLLQKDSANDHQALEATADGKGQINVHALQKKVEKLEDTMTCLEKREAAKSCRRQMPREQDGGVSFKEEKEIYPDSRPPSCHDLTKLGPSPDKLAGKLGELVDLRLEAVELKVAAKEAALERRLEEGLAASQREKSEQAASLRGLLSGTVQEVQWMVEKACGALESSVSGRLATLEDGASSQVARLGCAEERSTALEKALETVGASLCERLLAVEARVAVEAPATAASAAAVAAASESQSRSLQLLQEGLAEVLGKYRAMEEASSKGEQQTSERLAQIEEASKQGTAEALAKYQQCQTERLAEMRAALQEGLADAFTKYRELQEASRKAELQTSERLAQTEESVKQGLADALTKYRELQEASRKAELQTSERLAQTEESVKQGAADALAMYQQFHTVSTAAHQTVSERLAQMQDELKQASEQTAAPQTEDPEKLGHFANELLRLAANQKEMVSQLEKITGESVSLAKCEAVVNAKAQALQDLMQEMGRAFGEQVERATKDMDIEAAVKPVVEEKLDVLKYETRAALAEQCGALAKALQKQEQSCNDRVAFLETSVAEVKNRVDSTANTVVQLETDLKAKGSDPVVDNSQETQAMVNNGMKPLSERLDRLFKAHSAFESRMSRIAEEKGESLQCKMTFMISEKCGQLQANLQELESKLGESAVASPAGKAEAVAPSGEWEETLAKHAEAQEKRLAVKFEKLKLELGTEDWKPKLKDVKKQQDALKSFLDQFTDGMRAAFDKRKEEFDKTFLDKCDSLKEKVDASDELLVGLTAKVESLQRDLGWLDERVRQSSEEKEEKEDDAGSGGGGLTEEQLSQLSQLDGLDDRFYKIESQQSKQKQQVSKLTAETLPMLESRLEDVETFKESSEAQAKKAATATADSEAVGARLDAVEEAQNSIRGYVASVRREHEKFSKEVQERTQLLVLEELSRMREREAGPQRPTSPLPEDGERGAGRSRCNTAPAAAGAASSAVVAARAAVTAAARRRERTVVQQESWPEGWIRGPAPPTQGSPAPANINNARFRAAQTPETLFADTPEALTAAADKKPQPSLRLPVRSVAQHEIPEEEQEREGKKQPLQEQNPVPQSAAEVQLEAAPAAVATVAADAGVPVLQGEIVEEVCNQISQDAAALAVVSAVAASSSPEGAA
eukprot:TRINITY_DN4222_c0_g1_i2.p1 TRINITY_DN4222_c0_g1~~TRINITY_DN4222_c0_g1_i2.p1  ORF type:complete len:1765 (+),score=627.70 TRINITY_DN4222_c0_g1_i2:145-5439(+)